MKSTKISLTLGGLLLVGIFAVSPGCKSGGSSSGGDSAGNNPAPTPTTGAATLNWDAPALNSDGSPLDDLTGYKLHYGTTADQYDNVVDLGSVTSVEVTDLPLARHFFAVTAYDDDSNDSGLSNEVFKDIVAQ